MMRETSVVMIRIAIVSEIKRHGVGEIETRIGPVGIGRVNVINLRINVAGIIVDRRGGRRHCNRGTIGCRGRLLLRVARLVRLIDRRLLRAQLTAVPYRRRRDLRRNSQFMQMNNVSRSQGILDQGIIDVRQHHFRPHARFHQFHHIVQAEGKFAGTRLLIRVQGGGLGGAVRGVGPRLRLRCLHRRFDIARGRAEERGRRYHGH